MNEKRQTSLVLSNHRKFQTGFSQNQENERGTRMKPERMKNNKRYQEFFLPKLLLQNHAIINQ